MEKSIMEKAQEKKQKPTGAQNQKQRQSEKKPNDFISIELLPFDRTLRVYFVEDYETIYREYRDIEIRQSTIGTDVDGFHFRNEDLKGKLVDVIVILNDDIWKNAGWISKCGLIVHEIAHCVYHLMEYLGTECDEILAMYTQHIFLEIVSKYDFERNIIK